ncbi:ATP-binding cassette domain-containing protein [Nguyenibacter vanlangensis]|uniref:ATP-binding cassette domain-containing protein n=1 Tax=Nguyenibacter vanlangensis TaxID=1216886 RepID=A0ABZ3D7R6_9PROT
MGRMPVAVRILSFVLVASLLAPFAAGLARMGGADWHGVDRAALLRAAAVSLASASVATVAVALLGIPLGYLLARGRNRWLAVLGGVVQLPLALPPLASGILLLFLLGYGGPLGALGLGDSFAGIVVAQAFVAAPFAIVAARSAFSAVDPAIEDVAATLGHGPGAVLWRVSLPLAWRAILAGLLLAWLRAFGEFGATVMVAYHPYSLPVFTYVAFGESGLPAMLPILAPTLLLAATILAAGQALTRPRRADAPLPGGTPAPLVETADSDAPPRTLSLALDHRAGGFHLRLACRIRARRVAILGASGSGKSMTLRLIAGLDDAADATIRPTIRLDDDDLGHVPPQRRRIAFVPQGYALPAHLTVARQVSFAADSTPDRAAAWMKLMGLDELSARYPHQLSPGQRQRVALARALSRREVDLVLLDEPFSALDAPLRARLRRDVLRVLGPMRAMTILVTHDPAEAMEMAEEVILLDGGRIVRAGPVASVFTRPGSEIAARLLGADQIHDGLMLPCGRMDIGGGVALCIAGDAPAAGTAMRWAVRPHQVRLAPDGDYPAAILRRGALRDGQHPMRLRLGAAILDIPTDPSDGVTGDACRVRIDPGAIQLWPRDPGP